MMRDVEGPVVHAKLGVADSRMQLSEFPNKASPVEQRQLDEGVSFRRSSAGHLCATAVSEARLKRGKKFLVPVPATSSLVLLDRSVSASLMLTLRCYPPHWYPIRAHRRCLFKPHHSYTPIAGSVFPRHQQSSCAALFPRNHSPSSNARWR